MQAKNVVVKYGMNERGKMNPTFINNYRHVSLYMLNVAADSSRPLLRINVVPGSPTIPSPQPTIDEHDSFEDEILDAHPMDLEDHLMELEDPIFSKEGGEECELGAQTNHTFSDETNFQVNQTFSSIKELKLLLDVAAVRNSFDYTTLKSSSKFLKVKYVCPSCGWMLRAKKYECTDRFVIYKYVGNHNCDIEYATRCHRKISPKVIASLCVNMHHEGKGLNTTEIRRIIFKKLKSRPSYWQYWLGGVIAKEIVRGTAEHGYFCLPAFLYMIDAPNVGTTYSIMVNKVDCRFMYYFLSLGPCIRGFDHMRKVIAIDDTHLYGKYEGVCHAPKSNRAGLAPKAEKARENPFKYLVLLSAVAQDTENHIYPIAFCIIDKENDASWTFFFEKLKSIMVNGPDLCFISDRHKSIANDIAKAYNHAHHRAYFPGNRFDVMTTNIVESVNAMLIVEREYPVTSIFNSITKRKFDLVKIPCNHVMAALRLKHCEDYGLRFYDYSSPLYKVEEYLFAYSKSINVVPLGSE
ncbi:hypothetical protein FXO38_11087 [Capsicum annuum]|nr:hypothetical protein FXO38_11087 [Capsicum annuum]